MNVPIFSVFSNSDLVNTQVEVWDVVDVAKKRVKIEGLKTSESGQELAPGLDAEFLDVYQVIFGLTFKSADLSKEQIGIGLFPQGTHGVIMVMDITKAWTMDYIRKESEKVISLSTESKVIEK